MEEVRRFLRFTLPGLVCIIELIIALSITNPSKISSIYNKSHAAYLGVFLASGGFGFLLSIIYFGIYRVFYEFMGADHRKLFRSLKREKNGKFRINDLDGEELSPHTLSKRDSWALVCKLWYSKIEENKEFKGLNNLSDRIIDISHGLGATFVGTLLSYLAWYYIQYTSNIPFYTFINLVVSACYFLIILIIIVDYFMLVKDFQDIINSTLFEHLIAEDEIKLFVNRKKT